MERCIYEVGTLNLSGILTDDKNEPPKRTEITEKEE